MNVATQTKISADNVAAMLAGEWDDVPTEERKAVLLAILDRNDAPEDALVKSLPVTVRVWDDQSSVDVEAAWGDDYDDVDRDSWEDADYGDGDYRVHVSWVANDASGDEIDSGSFTLEGHTEEPPCPESGDGHDWTSEHEGGCTENPGVWSTGGTSMLFVARCRHCGMERRESTTGAQCNPGECDTTEYSEPDPEWVADHYGED